MRQINLAIKRCVDFLGSLIGLIILSPFLLIIAFIIKLTSKGTVFFLQDRLGKNGKTFKIIKFRTMVMGAENKGDGLFVYGTNDNRITAIGKILRKTSLDGNVIIGTTTESLVNQGFREVSPIHFFTGRDQFSDFDTGEYGYSKMLLSA